MGRPDIRLVRQLQYSAQPSGVRLRQRQHGCTGEARVRLRAACLTAAVHQHVVLAHPGWPRQRAAVCLPQCAVVHLPAASSRLHVRWALRRWLVRATAAQRPADGAAAAARTQAVGAPAASACWACARGLAGYAPQLLVRAQAADASWAPVARKQEVSCFGAFLMLGRGMCKSTARRPLFMYKSGTYGAGLAPTTTLLCEASLGVPAAPRLRARLPKRSLLCHAHCLLVHHVPPFASCNVPQANGSQSLGCGAKPPAQGNHWLAWPRASAGLTVVALLM